MATVKKAVKKAANGSKQPPTYKNLKMGVANSRKESTPTKQDSALYRFGYNRGLRGEKEYPNEPPIQKMGRWEGQNVGKKKMKTGGTLAPSKKSVGKTIGKLNKAKSGGSFPDLNKDGKITKADILKGRGVIAKKGMKIKKAQDGIMENMKEKSKMTTKDPSGNYKIKIKQESGDGKITTTGKVRRTLKGFLSGAPRPNASKKNYSSETTYKKGGTMKKSMKTGGKMTKKCKYGCK